MFSLLILSVKWIRSWVDQCFCQNPNWEEDLIFFEKSINSVILKISILENKDIGLYLEHSTFELSFYVAIILPVFKIKGKIPEEKNWLTGILVGLICLYLTISKL